MDDVKEMLKAVINGQHALRSDLLGEIANLRKDSTDETKSLRQEMRGGFENVNKHLDKLEKRVEKIEQHVKN